MWGKEMPYSLIWGETEVLIDGGEVLPGVVSYLKGHVDGPLEAMAATLAFLRILGMPNPGARF